MRLASIGDIHASHDNIKDTELGMKSLIRTLEDKDIQYLLISGDIFHDFNIAGKESTFGSVFNSVNIPLNDWLQGDEKRRIIMIPGNHDMSTDKDQEDALVSFDFKSRIFVSHKIKNYNLSGGVNIITLPWMYPSMYKDKDDILQILKDCVNRNKFGINILLGHCEVEGSELPNNHVMFGGNFNFTKKEINDLNFNIITLGHIHKQQNGYNGTPWQHDFGESELDGKIRILDIADNKIYEDKLITLPNTVKYHNIGVNDIGIFRCGKHDHVKVKGKKLDKVLPRNFIFEKDKEIIKIKARTNASVTDNIETLLVKYLKDKNIETDTKELMEVLNKIDVKDCYLPSGSLEKFESVTLKNIGPHKDTHITFEDPILAISGPNGSGKTIFLESLFAALYGKFPSYGKISHLSENGEIIVVLNTSTDKYKIIRRISDGQQKAFIYKHMPESNHNALECLVGPKVGEVNKFIEKLIGPEELLLSSVFSTQFSSGDIVDLEPSDRKDIFHKLLGLDFILDAKEKIDNILDNNISQKEVIIAQLGTLSIEDLKVKIDKYKDLLINSSNTLQNNIDELDKYKKEHKELHIKSTILADKAMEKHKYEEELIEVTKQIKDLKETIFETLEDEKQIKTKREEFNKLTGELKNKSIKLSELLTINNIISENISKISKQTDKMGNKIEIYRTKIDNLKEEENNLKDVGCKDNLLPCKFISSATNAHTEITRLANERDEWLKEERIVIQQLNNWNEKLLNEKQKCIIPEVDEDRHTELDGIIIDLEERVKDLNANKSVIKDKENFKIRIKDKISELGDIPEDKIQPAIDRMHDIEIEIKKLEESISHYKISIAEIKKELEFCKRELLEYIQYETQLKELNIEIDKISILSRAFSKNGIPQLIIDSALPQLQDILNILTKYISKFSIHVSTQGLKKDGGMKETISFIVDDGFKKRDVKYYSGGEKKLLKSLIRLSLSIFQTQRTNRNYKVLFMDEAFDALDKLNALLLLRILHNLSSRFNQIFIVSHLTEVLYNLSNCIKFDRDHERTIIK